MTHFLSQRNRARSVQFLTTKAPARQLRWHARGGMDRGGWGFNSFAIAAPATAHPSYAKTFFWPVKSNNQTVFKEIKRTGDESP
jgi:hypothetical protein